MNNLYTVAHFTHEAGKITATITVDAGHKIFEGHFPGQPVLPGVCQLQIVKELLEKALDKKLFLSEAGLCKFLQMVDPVQTPFLEISIDYMADKSAVAVNAALKKEETIFFKMKGTFNVTGNPEKGDAG